MKVTCPEAPGINAFRWVQEPPETWLATLVLFITAFLLYAPALNRVFVADQIWYFAELNGSTSLLDGLRHYDYAATRVYWKGDDALFRPLLFVWLAIGNTLFSYHHVWWNIANVCLHAMVAVALFRLLVTIQPSTFAFPIALLFTVLAPQLELVLLNHLGGYLLGAFFLLTGFRAFAQLAADDQAENQRKTRITCGLAFTAAALCHESMVPAAAIAGIMIFGIERKRSRAPRFGSLFLPPLIYAILYTIHVLRVDRLTYVNRPDMTQIFGAASIAAVISAVVGAAFRWTVEVMFPSALEFRAEPFRRLFKILSFDWRQPSLVLNAALVLTGAVVFVSTTLSRQHLRRVAPLIALIATAIVSYIAVICVGRAYSEVIGTTYYLYVFAALLVALLYAASDLSRLGGQTRVAAAVALAGLIIVNAVETRSATRMIGQKNRAASDYFVNLARFVDGHKHEPDFSFAVDRSLPMLDPDIVLRTGYPDQRQGDEVRPLSQILFSRYYDAEHPKYLLNSMSLR